MLKLILFLFVFVFSAGLCCANLKPQTSVSVEGQKARKTVLKQQTSDAVVASNLSEGKKQPQQPALEYLIEKLNYLDKTLPKNHKARNPIRLRLAHALSLKAEEDFIKAEKGGCKSCGQSGRLYARQSLSVYQKTDGILSARHPLLHTEALFKQAYLHRLLGENFKSLKALKRIIVKKGLDSLLSTRAYFNIGEIYFELYDYEKSLKAFNHILKREKSPWSFRALYRKIWSLSNLSLYEQSIEELESFLKSNLYSNPNLSREERKLKEKLESELITLYSYAKVTDQRVTFLYKFSKQDQSKNTRAEKNKRLFDLAMAFNRIGRRSESNTVWGAYISKAPGLKRELKAYSAMLDNDRALGGGRLLESAGLKIEKILLLQNKIKMPGDLKRDIRKQLKSFLNHAGKNQSVISKDKQERLFALYQKYNSSYPGDLAVLSRSALLAVNLKQQALAQDLFQSAVLSMSAYKDEKISKKEKIEMKEKMSVGQMEMAELTKDEKRRIDSYKFYIQHGGNKELIFKARYQFAYINYANKKYKSAEKQFTSLASDREAKKINEIQELRLKAAHLSLSALDEMGNQEEALAQRSGVFMEEFPKNRREFLKIRHAALLNTVKKLVADRNFSRRPVQASTDENILKAWETLQSISAREATKEESFTYHFNKLLLAKELLKFEQMDQSLQVLLSFENLKEEDEKTILTWKLWLAELRFDFKEILRIVKLLQPKNQSEDQLLRLARLAELASQSPVPYYKIFIKNFPNSPSATAVLISLVEKSSYGERALLLREYAPLFKDQPGTLTHLVLKTDRGRLDENFIKPFTEFNFMKQSSLNLFLRRKRLIEFFEKDLKRVSSYSLFAKLSGHRLTRAIKSWTNRIDQLQKTANVALGTGDWTARVFIISHLEKELSRFYDFIMGLPLPKGLTEEEQQQYSRLLKEQMKGYKQQISQLQEELSSLWSRDWTADYRKGLEQDIVFHAPLKWEMEKLLMVFEGENKRQIQDLLSSVETSNQAQMQKAPKIQNGTQSLYKALKKNPFDQKSLMELLELEKKRNNEALSYYLVDRIKELKKNKRGIKL